jgi:hypothetical protein
MVLLFYKKKEKKKEEAYTTQVFMKITPMSISNQYKNVKVAVPLTAYGRKTSQEDLTFL